MRHRFLRANGAASVAAVIIAIPLFLIMSFNNFRDWPQMLSEAGVFFSLFVASLVVAIVLSSLVERIHRRAIGIAGAIVAAVLALSSGLLAIVFAIAGPLMLTRLPDAADSLPFGMYPFVAGLILVLIWFLAALFALFAVAQFEIARFFSWSVIAPRDLFMGVRGWRPAPHRLVENLFRQLGMPAFLAFLPWGRRSVAGYYFVVAIVDSLFFILLLIPASALQRLLDSDPDHSPIRLLAAAAVLILMLRSLRVGTIAILNARARATQLYQAVREWDERRPIVYLRPFQTDEGALPSAKGSLLLRAPAGLGRPRTFDEVLLETMSQWGPVLAIGDPRQPIPPLGAARIFTEGAGKEWQVVVRALLEAASIVVISPDQSKGISWELEQVREPHIQRKTLYLANPMCEQVVVHELFSEVIGAEIATTNGKRAIAAYRNREQAWEVLRSSEIAWQTVSVALSCASRAMLGEGSVETARAARGIRRNSGRVNLAQLRGELTRVPVILRIKIGWKEMLAPILLTFAAVGVGVKMALTPVASLTLALDGEALDRERLEQVSSEMTRTLAADGSVEYIDAGVDGDAARLRLLDPSQGPRAITLLRRLGAGDVAINESPEGLLEVRLTPTAAHRLRFDAVRQAMEVLRRRSGRPYILGVFGAGGPSIGLDGDERIRVTAPANIDLAKLETRFSVIGRISLHLVAENVEPSMVPPGVEQVQPNFEGSTSAFVASAGLDIGQPTHAMALQDQEGDPGISLTFSAADAPILCRFTTEHVGERVAVLIDRRMLAASEIVEPICGGSIVVMGTFSAERASEIAQIVRGGVLPAPLYWVH
jgi:hypothetical protein